jgi:DNA-binding GntR family transcriptional regulator
VFPTLSGWPKQSTKDHRRVIAALERGDGDAARSAMAEHFTGGVTPLTEHLVDRGVIVAIEPGTENAT